MSLISDEIGKRIRHYRKSQQLTQDDLAAIICKAKSTLSKYEKGEISLDIETMYEIASALHIHVEQLLYCPPARTTITSNSYRPAFFNGVSQFYSYLYDGRSNELIRCVFDVLSESQDNQYKIMMYMNYRDYDNYQNCETTYWGFIEHYDALTNIMLTNHDSPIEKASAHILASYLNADMKWGLFNGISSRPMMPIAVKMLFSRALLKEDKSLYDSLKVSREDIRILKHYNMLSVT